MKQLHDAVKRGEMAAPTPQQLAQEKAEAATLADAVALREPERKAALGAYTDCAQNVHRPCTNRTCSKHYGVFLYMRACVQGTPNCI